MIDIAAIATSSLLITAAVSSCLLGLLVLLRNPERITHRAFARLTLNLALWALGVFFIVHSHTEDAARNWIMITFVVASFLPATFYHFIAYFPDQKFKGLRWYFYLLYAGAFIVSALVNTTWYIVTVDVFPNEPPRVTYGRVFDVYTVMIVATMVLMFVNLFRKLRESEGIQRRQLEHVIASIFAGVGLASVTNVIAPFFQIQTMELYGPCFMVLMMAGLAYSMVRYHLMDIWFILSRTTVYAFVTVVVFVIYFSVVTLVHAAFSQVGMGRYDILSIALTSMMVALVIQPLRERTQLVLDRVILHCRYDT